MKELVRKGRTFCEEQDNGEWVCYPEVNPKDVYTIKKENQEAFDLIEVSDKDHITVFGIGAGRDSKHTTRFHDISNLEINDRFVTFEYVSASDGRRNIGLFVLDNISGIGTTIEEEDDE